MDDTIVAVANINHVYRPLTSSSLDETELQPSERLGFQLVNGRLVNIKVDIEFGQNPVRYYYLPEGI
jgi:hypothetical protein